MKTVSEDEFIQHPNKYLQWVKENHQDLTITSQHGPKFVIKKAKHNTFKELQGITKIKVKSDINAHVLPPFDRW
jgi:hypothetical protein